MTTTREGAPVAQAQGYYLYAVTDGIEDGLPLGLTGMDGGGVYALTEAGVTAVVSGLAARKVRPERRRLAAHHDVLKQLMSGHAALPMAFGLIADSSDDVRKILRLNRGPFVEQLARVRGKVEMGVRVAWDVANIFETVVAGHPEVSELRDHMFRGGRQPSQEEKIELGRRFDRALTAEREEAVERVTAVLENYCAEVLSNPPRNEREVMNLACLVDRDARDRFEHGVVEAAGLFDERYAFDFNGPWPAHNFVNLELRTS